MIIGLTARMSVILLVLLCAVTFNSVICCHERDRSLLLIFKQGIVDPSNRLSSWSTLQDCCQWQGVTCDYVSNRVESLDLSSSNPSESLRGVINSSSLLALEFLDALDLDSNDFERIITPPINISVATRSHLLPNSSKLSKLSLSYNIHLRIDNLHYWLSRLTSLTSLNLNGIHLPTETNLGRSLALLPLDSLYLYDCNFTTSSILSLEFANFSSLSHFDLGLNDFTYGLPNWLFNLSNNHLTHLYLIHCNLRGQIPDFSGYRNLEHLELSYNKLRGSIPDWLGQLHSLNHLDLSDNSFHSSIPSNLLNSSLQYLNISFNDLSGTIPKNLNQSFITILDLSHNSISGDISNLLLRSRILFLSFNKFKGELPQVSDGVQALDLAYNSFSGPLSSLLCFTLTNQSILEYLELSNNYLTHGLPHCWNNLTSLSYMYLGNNQLVGQVPPMMGSSLYNLRSLDLHNNGFFGEIPWTFHNCTSLVLINLARNNFSGRIQTWMPKSVIVVKLRSNQFMGNIPPQLCSLSNLTVLDLAHNKFSGSIPHCLHNTRTSLALEFLQNILSPALDIPLAGGMADSDLYMKIDLHAKGQQLEYDKNLKLVRSIDLSANKLSGKIPIQLSKLTKLQFLNLSYNYLIGKIPEQIGEMKDLESLDFSNNNLHGNIPQSMSGLSFLSVLNLSYNHFSGPIPMGTQLRVSMHGVTLEILSFVDLLFKRIAQYQKNQTWCKLKEMIMVPF